MRFIAFDLETTGTLPGVDQIAEIGAVLFDENGQPDTIFTTLIDPGIPMPEGASRVNGITDSMLVDAPLVAHNAAFDAQFLTADIKKFEMPAPQGLILDTLPLARKVYPGLANYKLGTLVQHLGIVATGFHRAEEDAGYCGQVFHKIFTRLTVNGVPPTVATLISLTTKPEMRFPKIEKSPKQLGLMM